MYILYLNRSFSLKINFLMVMCAMCVKCDLKIPNRFCQIVNLTKFFQNVIYQQKIQYRIGVIFYNSTYTYSNILSTSKKNEYHHRIVLYYIGT